MGYISACSIPNTIRRGKNYYLHFRLPNNKFFRASLGCDSAQKTKYILSRLSLFISLVKSDRIEPIHLLNIVKDMKKLEQKDIDDYLFHSQNLYYAAAKKIPTEIRKMLREGMPISPEKSNLKSLSRMLRGVYFSEGGPLLEDQVIEELSAKFELVGKEEEVDYIASQCDIFFKQYCDAKLAFLEQSQGEYLQLLASLEPRAINVLTAISSDHNKIGREESQMTLIEAWGEFIKFKSSWNDKIRQINEKYFEVIAIVLGKDKPVAEVSVQDIKRLLAAVKKLPKQNKKPYNKMTVPECLELKNIPKDDLVSSKTAKDYLKLCQSFFSTFLTKEKNILTSSPTKDVSLEYKSISYGAYTDTEMKSLVGRFLSEENWMKWIFLLLAYTGARRGEIIKLTSKDVRFDADTARYYLMIKESKTVAGTRQIPVHNFLINNGFMDFVNSRDGLALFADVSYFNKATKAFHRIRNELGIPYRNDFDEPRVVHSLRHTFITSVMTKVNTTLAQQVIGHELSNIGETKRYTHRATLSELLKVVDSIDWS
ncbi:tyrosine-type recombinase/integrase [Rahnella contaminans]|uniref:tyrosine-type recombinase/integrase n=1 Tax=Rahnella contaminans TaxID=2703882 RepID=UPI0023DA9E34|nr:tyrosine-type recombinase/integrase [Rahnella contaminans]MDF1895545.1 tyrosine-type recombinase/integrase [Rahnella contaminans]